MGLYRRNADTSLTLVASTASTTTILNATNTTYSVALQSPFTLVPGDLYYVGLLMVGNTNGTALGQVNVTTGTALWDIVPTPCKNITGQTDLPNSVAAGAGSNGVVVVNFGLMTN
jgi:hypothetical protein